MKSTCYSFLISNITHIHIHTERHTHTINIQYITITIYITIYNYIYNIYNIQQYINIHKINIKNKNLLMLHKYK